MFEGSQTKKLDLSNFDTNKVTKMIRMFAHSQAKELDLTSFTISDKTNINYMFRNTPYTKVLINEEAARQIQGGKQWLTE